MTIQVTTKRFASSKKTMQDAMNSGAIVAFNEPTPFGTRVFTNLGMRVGEAFACVMDPETRRRFSQVKRVTEKSWRVT